MWLGFQLTEQSGNINNNNSRSATMGGFDILAWQFVEIINSKGRIKAGRQSLSLYAPPIKRPPFDPSKCIETKIKLDFTMEDIDYTEN